MSDQPSGRQPIVAGNWKMNTTVAEGLALVDDLRRTIDRVSTVERVICPPFLSIYPIVERLRGSEIAVGAQNLYFQPSGAFTGEISAEMLAELVRYVIVGHSERRHVMGESDEVVAKKLRAAVEAGLLPILCVGETLDEREAGQTETVLRRQVRSALSGQEPIPGLVLRLRAGLGNRHWPGGYRRGCQRRQRHRSQRASERPRRRRGCTDPHPVRRQRHPH